MYSLDKLTFEFSSLEPFIDTHTMALHYLKHQATYLNNLNKLIKNYNFKYSLEDLYNHLDEIKEEDINDCLFNLGGVINHNLYWKSINPKDKEIPKGKLLEAINKKYLSMDNFWEKFKALILSLKGSGYVFLIKTRDLDIDLIITCNQDSPYLYGYTPLLAFDLWEHAYYINYENDKLRYFENFKTIVNFRYANNIFNT